MGKNIIILLIIILAVGSTYFLINQFSQTEVNGESKESIYDPSLDNIKKNKKIVIGTSGVFEPMSFKDEDNKLVGIDVDLAKAISQRLGVDTEFKLMPFEDLFDAVEKGDVDIAVDSITVTAKRKESFLFSVPYYDTGQGIIVLDINSSNIKSPEDLKGKKIGVQKGTTGEEEAFKLTGEHNTFSFNERKEIAALKEGSVDAVITDHINALMIVKKEKDLKIVGGIFSEEYYGVMSKKGNKTLIEEINNLIREMRDNDAIKAIENKWTK